jgi:LysM repeat protein
MGPTQPVSATLTRSAAAANPGNLTPGSTIRHQVVTGEWLWQIARCYGADPQKVSEANPPTPGEISPNTTVIVPNIGSAGKIYGPPCVGTHTVQNGETWNSIAQKYNADVTVLQMANAYTLNVGKVLKIPLNSAGGTAANPGTTPGSTAANCVDLARNLKFVGLNTASPTHFNFCGPMDTGGKMKIATLKVYQRPEDVPQGALSQDLTISIETATPMNDPNSLVIADMNYDGNDDFRIIKNLPASPNVPYLYYLFDPTTRKFVYSAAYEAITSPEFTGNSEIRSKWKESATKWGIDTYKVTNSIPALTQKETWEAVNTTQALHRVMTFDAVGVMKVTVEETIPLPTQP